MSSLLDLELEPAPPQEAALAHAVVELADDASAVPVIRRTTTTVLAECGCPKAKVPDGETVAAELATNAIRANHAANWQGRLRVSWWFYPWGMAILIEDHWPGMDAPETALPEEGERLGGLGLTVIAAVSDGIVIVPPHEGHDGVHKDIGAMFRFPVVPERAIHAVEAVSA